MKLPAILLFPFSLLLATGVHIRNFLFDASIRKSFKPKQKSICVGNLALGGTGKSPMVEFLIRQLSDQQVYTLSRGYGRKTKGFLQLDESMTASESGDEPLQYFKKFRDIKVFVGEDRSVALQKIETIAPGKIAILDDAFQHRKVQAGLNILITRYDKPFFKDHLFPSGSLRDVRRSARRADMIIASKCPSGLSKDQRDAWKNAYKKSGNTPIFFSHIEYGKAVKISDNEAIQHDSADEFLLVSGIAFPEPFFDYLKDKFGKGKMLRFPDHHRYSLEDVKKIQSEFKMLESQNKVIFTTEKDAMRLLHPELINELNKLPVFYVPIRIAFNNEEKEQITTIINKYVRKNSADR